MWVLAGRGDIAWLEAYLPRAKDFSDDGVTWRGAYGPRLRHWNGVDQIDEVRKLLLADGATRRAVAVLFDPDRDFVVSKDIPCNNWLHWLIRDGLLTLNIAVRGNDVVWGFSGVNAFEFSVLQEMMAFWTQCRIGASVYFASSFHVYSRHYTRAAEIVEAFPGLTCYDFGVHPPTFGIPWNDFGGCLRRWFEVEAAIRQSPDAVKATDAPIGDALLDSALQMCRLYLGSKNGWSRERIRSELSALATNDFAAAAYEYFARKDEQVLLSIPQGPIAAFFDGCKPKTSGQRLADTAQLIPRFIKALHREKDAGYGRSWKKRGEMTSILANIARKADRLDVFVTSRTELSDESVFDTAVDLFVYITKYRLFLLETMPDAALALLSPGAPTPYSESPDNFDTLVDRIAFESANPAALGKLVPQIHAALDVLHDKASLPNSLPKDKFALASNLSELSVQLIVAVLRDVPTALAFLRHSAVGHH
jgi:thymidylate synthase